MSMRVIERSVYRGPHVYGSLPMIRFRLDLQDLEGFPTNALPGFAHGLMSLLPGLSHHGCSRGHPSGFVERLDEGTWLGHVVEHVALELQTLAGDPVSRGKTRSVKRQPGVYDVLYAYGSVPAGLAAGRLALEIVDGLLPAHFRGVVNLDRLASVLPRTARERPPGIDALERLIAANSLGPTTRSLVDAASARGIPVQRLDEQSLVRLGWGSRQHLVRASILDTTSHLAVTIAGDKRKTKDVLAAAGVPVPRGVVATAVDEAVEFARRVGGTVVTKPLNGNHGRGVTTALLGDDAVRRGFESARVIAQSVIVEEHLTGADYRVLVIGGSVVAVAERMPPRITGDGRSTVSQLIGNLNADSRRGIGHKNVLTRVLVDDALQSVLADQSLRLLDVPQPGRSVVLRQTANLSTGGEAADRTDNIHPEVRAMVERAVRLIGLDVAGVDLVTTDITRPLAETGGGIVEVNAAPGFRMHLSPSIGAARPVAEAAIEYLYPRGSRSRIPIISVTGTNGKSTTVRMIAHIMNATGESVGMTNTSGVYVGGRLITAGDSSGPKSARRVLADSTVDVAVLETARGGLLREGLAYDRADVGVVLNVSADHLGLKGIDTLRDLARVKSVIAQQVRKRGTTVLNADDPHTLRMTKVAGGRVALFSTGTRAELNARVDLRALDVSLLGTLEAGPNGAQILTLHDGEETIPLMLSDDIPATLGGAAIFNTSNALAAALAAYAQRVSPTMIAAALTSFESSFEQNPGRLNVTRAPGFTTIVDYAHNPAALRAMGDLIAKLRPDYDRVIGVISIPGDRRDADIIQLGAISARIFDEVIFRELPDGRGRPAGGVVGLLSDAAQDAGMPPDRIRRVMDELDAMTTALESAGPRDLVILTVSNVEGVWNRVQSFSSRVRLDA